MEKNMTERDDFDEAESKEIAVDFEDVLVQPVDGVVIQDDNEKIKLLFFYVKPESNHDEDSVARSNVWRSSECLALGSWIFQGTLT
jgi:hypothetical protein